MSDFWDRRFAGPRYKYGIQPNAWLCQQAHHVLAVDSSAVGLAKAQPLAQQSGVVIDTLCADLADWQPAPASVEAVVLVFVHLRPALRATALTGPA